MSNLLVKNGVLIDGTGSAGRRADVRISDGLVAEVGPDLAPDGEEVFDAAGAIVCPGFIDSHTHLDPSMFWDPGCDPMPQHGVTTALIGNCSLSLAPVKPEHLEEVMDVFCYIEDMPIEEFTASSVVFAAEPGAGIAKLGYRHEGPERMDVDVTTADGTVLTAELSRP